MLQNVQVCLLILGDGSRGGLVHTSSKLCARQPHYMHTSVPLPTYERSPFHGQAELAVLGPLQAVMRRLGSSLHYIETRTATQTASQNSEGEPCVVVLWYVLV